MAISVKLNNSIHQFWTQITFFDTNHIFVKFNCLGDTYGTDLFMLDFLTNEVVVFSHLLYSNGSFSPQNSVDSTDCEGIC